MTWAYGMVTAPREQPTLAGALKSMIHSGWTRPFVFAEPGTSSEHLPEGCTWIERRQRLNAWENYRTALEELISEQPDADAYLVAQDDILFAEHDGNEPLRSFLERSLWPFPGQGVVSLYCSLKYAREAPGWRPLEEDWVWGACCFIWPRDSLKHFLQTTAREWSAQRRDRKVDIAVGVWARQQKTQVWYCSPSLVQHVGDTSTIWGPENRATGRRSARDFVGDMLCG